MAKRIKILESLAAATHAVDAALREADTALRERRPAEAERITRQVLSGAAQHPQAAHLLGMALLAQQRPREAVAPLETAARYGGADPFVATHLAAALRQTGRLAEALSWLERATAWQPPFLRAFQDHGTLLCVMRRFAEAEIVIGRGLELHPTDPELSIVLGGIFLNRADPAGAKRAFARALANAPGQPRALHGFGTALLFEGDFSQAARRFRQVLVHDPAHARAQLDLGHCLLELGEWDEAVACLRATVKAAPELYGRALRTLAGAARGRFWIRPGAAAEFLMPGTNLDPVQPMQHPHGSSSPERHAYGGRSPADTAD